MDGLENIMDDNKKEIDELKNHVSMLERKTVSIYKNYDEAMGKFFDYKKRVDTWIQDQSDSNNFTKKDLEDFAKLMNYKITKKYNVSIIMEQDVVIDAEDDEDLKKIVLEDLKIDLSIRNNKIKDIRPKIAIKNFEIG